MKNITSTAGQILQTFLPRARRSALATGETLPKEQTGCCLFADVSGFTPLTESLRNSLGPQQGAEVLTAAINDVFEALISQVHRYGGDVMGFAGDAILCWFPEAVPQQVLACAMSMQAEMQQFAAVPTPDGKTHNLEIKVGVSHGQVRRLLVGTPEYGRFELLTGETISRMAEAEHHAEKGDIICAPELVSALDGTAEWGESREGFRPLLSLKNGGELAPVRPTLADLDPKLVQPFFPPQIFQWLAGSQGALLAELRPVVSAFIRFTGLDYENDPQVEEKLDQYVRIVQRLAGQYGGSMARLDYGDKGSVAHVIFGAPITHEDDDARAIGWSLEVQAAVRELPFISGQQIGMTKGQVYAGALGACSRRGYTLMGDEVNASARLMTACQPGQILVSQGMMQTTQRQFMFHQFPGFQVKGKYEPIPVAMPTAPLPPLQQMIPSGPLIGREQEMAQLNELMDIALAEGSRILRIEGEEGVGKSRLVAELVQEAAKRGIRTLVGNSRSVGQDTPYLPWRDIFQVLFGLQPTWPAMQQAMQIENMVRWINPDWLIRVPLLGDVLGIEIPDNPTTAAFDARLRQQSLFALLGDLLIRMSQQQPLLILIEDCHWLDQASTELVENLGLGLAAARVLLIITQRPELPDEPFLPGLNRLEQHQRLLLKELPSEAVRAIVTARLGGELPTDIMRIIEERAHGNPLFVEELAETIRETSHLEKVEGRWVLVGTVDGPPDLPDSIQAVVLARLDRLEEGSKLTIKVASVVGQAFEVEAVQTIHLEQIAHELLLEQLQDLERRDLVLEQDPEPRRTNKFKTSSIREVAYTTLLYAQRRELHRAVAAWYEQALNTGEVDSLSPHYPLLVYHYHQAQVPERERHYARLAGEQAARQCANEEAVNYLSRALELMPADDEWAKDRYALLLTREGVYDTQGDREKQQQDLLSLEELADLLDDNGQRAQVALRQANYAEATGDYATVIARAQQAIPSAQEAKDVAQEAEGYLQWGRGLHRQGAFEDARTRLEKALTQARAVNQPRLEAESLQSLGMVFIYQGNYDQAMAHYEQALHIYQEIGDRLGQAKSMNGLGMICGRKAEHEQAKDFYEQVIDICQEIGDRRGESMLLGNLGFIHLGQGDYAKSMTCFEDALILFRKIGERRSEALVQVNLGFLDLSYGNYDRAMDYCEQSLQIYRQIGDQQGESRALSNLGLLFHHLGDNETGREYSQQAVQTTQSLGDRSMEGEALAHLGHALTGLEQFAEASAAYQQSLGIRQELGEQPLAMESLSGLARIFLAQGQPEQALHSVEEILHHLTTGNLDGTEEPLRIYLTCYRVLRAHQGDERALALLAEAHYLLQQRAARISDETMRHSFLQEVAAHRELVQEYEQYRDLVPETAAEAEEREQREREERERLEREQREREERERKEQERLEREQREREERERKEQLRREHELQERALAPAAAPAKKKKQRKKKRKKRQEETITIKRGSKKKGRLVIRIHIEIEEE